MWVVFAIGSAFFAGVTSILAKCGIRKTDSNVATAIRTIIVLAFSWIMVGLVGSFDSLKSVETKTWIFLILSGTATGASWLCYFRALQLGNINKVVPIDKSSTVLTILLATLLLNEGMTWIKGGAVILIGVGTLFMIQKKSQVKSNCIEAESNYNEAESSCNEAESSCNKAESSHNELDKKLDNVPNKGKAWLLYAVFSAVFASLTAILGKIGISGIESNLGTAIRTCVVLVMAWIVVFVTHKQKEVLKIEKRELGFIALSGLATGASWLCYYKALQDGPASVVVPVDKLSILITIAFSYLVFKEKLTAKAGIGLLLIVAGTLLMLL